MEESGFRLVAASSRAHDPNLWAKLLKWIFGASTRIDLSCLRHQSRSTLSWRRYRTWWGKGTEDRKDQEISTFPPPHSPVLGPHVSGGFNTFPREPRGYIWEAWDLSFISQSLSFLSYAPLRMLRTLLSQCMWVCVCVARVCTSDKNGTQSLSLATFKTTIWKLLRDTNVQARVPKKQAMLWQDGQQAATEIGSSLGRHLDRHARGDLKWKKWETKLHRYPSFICLKHINTEKAYTEWWKRYNSWHLQKTFTFLVLTEMKGFTVSYNLSCFQETDWFSGILGSQEWFSWCCVCGFWGKSNSLVVLKNFRIF